MRWATAVGALLVSACAHGTAWAWRNHGVALNCPYSTAVLDGCAASSVGTYVKPTFFAGYAQQSGQTWASLRPSWNVAGVDYPVGPPLGAVFSDPATATLPATCSYSATGSATGGPLVTCVHAVNPDFESFDFSGTKVGSHGAVLVSFTGGVTGTVTFNNCDFALDNGTTNDSSPVNLGSSGSFYPNLVFTNNLVLGNALTITNGVHNGIGVAIGITGNNARIQYNAFVNIPSRIISGTLNGILQFDHNLVDGWMMTSSGVHGEIATVLPTTGIVPLVAYQYNTILIPASTQGFYTAPLYISNGSETSTVVVTDTKIDHNVVVGNAAATNATPTSVSLASFDYNNYGSAEINYNYVDTTGSLLGALHCGHGAVGAGSTGILPVHTAFASPIFYANNIIMNSTSATLSMGLPSSVLTSGGSGYANGDVVNFGGGLIITVTNTVGGVISAYRVTSGSTGAVVATQVSDTAAGGGAGSGSGATIGPSCTGF